MPRRKAAIKREILPDPLYGSEQVAKFVNVVMRKGKKSIAEKIIYRALTMLSDRVKKESKDDSEGDKGSDKGGKGKKAAPSTSKVKTHVHSHSYEEALDTLKRA